MCLGYAKLVQVRSIGSLCTSTLAEDDLTVEEMAVDELILYRSDQCVHSYRRKANLSS